MAGPQAERSGLEPGGSFGRRELQDGPVAAGVDDIGIGDPIEWERTRT